MATSTFDLPSSHGTDHQREALTMTTPGENIGLGPRMNG